MKIVRTRIRNINLYVYPELLNKFVRVVSPFEGLSEKAFDRIRLSGELAEGESYLPPAIGRFSRFNSEGKWVPLRDQPKENRYIRTIHWKWKQWARRGRTEEMEDSRDIYRLCYPRYLTPPPSEEIFGFPINDRVHAATEAVSLPLEADRLLHQVNLMLELFGSCEVVRADGTSAFLATTYRRWIFLPQGPYKAGDVSKSISQNISKLSTGDQIILKDRQDFLTGLDPQEVVQGIGGFGDYLAYVFPQFRRVVLESLRRDNAIYVFKGQWESFSRLTKRQILDANVHDARVLHTRGWQDRLIALLKQT